MSDKFSWRDGWGLTVTKAKPTKVTQVIKEKITRCEKDGNYIYNEEPCTICNLVQEK